MGRNSVLEVTLRWTSIPFNRNTVKPLHNSHPGAELTGHSGEVAIVGRLKEEQIAQLR